MKYIGVLNGNGNLVDRREIADDDPLITDETPIDPGDLPLDGTYLWNAGLKRYEPRMKRVPILDARSRLIGADMVPVTVENDMPDPGDLPLTGTYVWDGVQKVYRPAGLGMGKVVNPVPPYSTEYVMVRLIEYLIDRDGPDALPGPALEWREWFNSDLRLREDERHVGEKVMR